MFPVGWSAIFTSVKIYLAWVTIHYLAAQLYIYACVPATLYGFLFSPMQAVAPQCNMLRWAITYGGSEMNALGVAGASLILQGVLTPKKRGWKAMA